METTSNKILSFEEFTQQHSNQEIGTDTDVHGSPDILELPLGNQNEPAPAEEPETGDMDNALSTNMMDDTEPNVEVEETPEEDTTI
jgi:hypothetical protein